MTSHRVGPSFRITPVHGALGLVFAVTIAFAGWRWSQPRVRATATRARAPLQSSRAIKAEAAEYQQRGDLEGFIRALDRLSDHDDDKPRALLEQALTYRQMADGIHFESTIAKCLSHEQNLESPSQATVGAWGILVDHYWIQERWDEARDLCWNLVRVAADPSRKKQLLLRILAPDDERFDLAELIAWHEQFVARNPADFNARRALGLNLARNGRMDEARFHLEACVKENPESDRFVESWVWFLLLAGETDQASDVLNYLPTHLDQRDIFWVHRGRLSELRGDWVESVQCFRTALSISPRRLDANNRLAQALRMTRDSVAADEQSEVARQLAEAKRNLLNTREDLLRKGVAPDTQGCARLAELCRFLGMTKEAQAWSELE